MASNAKFIAQINKFAKLSAKTANEETRKVALVGLSGVVNKSPVEEGTLRGNWNVGINNTDTSIDTGKKDKVGSQTISQGGSIIGRFKNGENIIISNNLPYAQKAEVRPPEWFNNPNQGMIRRTFAELKNWIRTRRRKV
jgi:hypothetical protein